MVVVIYIRQQARNRSQLSLFDILFNQSSFKRIIRITQIILITRHSFFPNEFSPGPSKDARYSINVDRWVRHPDWTTALIVSRELLCGRISSLSAIVWQNVSINIYVSQRLSFALPHMVTEPRYGRDLRSHSSHVFGQLSPQCRRGSRTTDVQRRRSPRVSRRSRTSRFRNAAV